MRVRLPPPAPSVFCDLREAARIDLGNAVSIVDRRSPGQGRIDVVGLSKWAPRIQPPGGSSGVTSIDGSIDRQVDTLVRHDAVGVDETRLYVLRLEPGVALEDRLRAIPRGEHPENMFDGKSTAADSRFPAEDPGVGAVIR